MGNEPPPQTDDVPTSQFVERTTTARKIPIKSTRTIVRQETQHPRLTMTTDTDSIPPTSHTQRRTGREAKERSPISPYGINCHLKNGTRTTTSSRTPHIQIQEEEHVLFPPIP